MTKEQVQKINFMHIPKCGGTTLHQLIDDDVHIDRVLLPVVRQPQLSVLMAGWKREGRDVAAALREYLAGFDRFHGHTNLTGILGPEWFVFTFLREPAERLVSLYNHWRTFTDEELAGAEQRNARSRPLQDMKRWARQATLGEFLERAGRERLDEVLFNFDNGMCNALIKDSPDGRRGRILKMSVEDRAAAAIGRLERMPVVGVLERMDESLALLFARTRLRPQPAPGRKNARAYSREDTVGDARALVERMTAADRIVYDWACARLGREYAALQQELGAADTAGVYAGLEARYRSRELAAARAQQAAGTLPARVVLGMKQGLRGNGWLERHGLNRPLMWRWSGPGREADLDLRLAPAPRLRVVVETLPARNGRRVAGAELALNGRWVPARVRRTWWLGFRLEAEFGDNPLGGEPLARVGLRVARTWSAHDIDPALPDTQQRGLGVLRIRVQPA